MLIKLPEPAIQEFYTYLKKQHPGQGIALEVMGYLKKCAPHFQPDKMERKYAYKKIFKGAVYNEKRLFNSLSDLYKFLNTFLQEQYLKKHPLVKDLVMMQIYQAYDLTENYFKLHKKIEADLAKEKQKDLWNPLLQMYLSQEHYYFPETERVDTKEVKIRQAIDALNEFHSRAKLKYLCELYNRYNTLGEELSKAEQLEAKQLLAKEVASPVYRCYQYTLQLLKDRKNEDFAVLKTALFEYQEYLIPIDRQILISYLLNHQAYCIRKGDGVSRDALDLYKVGIEKQFFIYGDCFEETHFINIVDLARSLDENDWAEGFIEQWGAKIEAGKREIVTLLSKALVLFSREKYNEVIHILSQIRSSNIHYEIRIRGLRIAAHYESEDRDDEAILQLCNLYEQFIRRRDTPKSKEQGVLFYLRMIRKLLDVNSNQEQLKKEVAQAKQFLYKKWLLKKIEERST